MLISEFGANTIEAGDEGQARLIRESWAGLKNAGAAGGIVFEFADEWWKNYDNPVRRGDWWTRVPAPDDELRHDEDPEETYGLVRADRTETGVSGRDCDVCRTQHTRHGSHVRDDGAIGDRAGGSRSVDMGTPSPCAEDGSGPTN